MVDGDMCQLGVPHSGGKLRERGADALGTGCPKTPLLPRSQVTDSVCPEFLVLDAHKELFLTIETYRNNAGSLADSRGCFPQQNRGNCATTVQRELCLCSASMGWK
jgi:hypothetical protein